MSETDWAGAPLNEPDDVGDRSGAGRGFTADCCVLTSIYDAYARDYRVSLVPDRCAATNTGSHRAAVSMMANWIYGIEILTAGELIKKVAGDLIERGEARHPTRDSCACGGTLLPESGLAHARYDCAALGRDRR